MVSEPHYHTIKFFPENALATKMEKKKQNTHTHTQVIKNKLVYLSLSIHKTRKIVIHEFWCDYVKPKDGEKVKLCYCYIDTDSFIIYIKTKHL